VNSLEPELTETEQEQREQSEIQTDSQIVTPASTPEIKQEDGHFASAPDAGETFGTEGVFPQQYPSDLSYSCLLIPRFHDHYLTGDITEALVEWMRQICISYGWRLDAITVRPGYLQWVMTVPLTTNPAQFMRLTRKHTSQKIFDDFPRYKRKNMSGDFWAPGYQVAAGNQLLSLESISNFTLAVRRQQGIF
jgi:REP element-mobilizing transposase RayT